MPCKKKPKKNLYKLAREIQAYVERIFTPLVGVAYTIDFSPEPSDRATTQKGKQD